MPTTGCDHVPFLFCISILLSLISQASFRSYQIDTPAAGCNHAQSVIVLIPHAHTKLTCLLQAAIMYHSCSASEFGYLRSPKHHVARTKLTCPPQAAIMHGVYIVLILHAHTKLTCLPQAVIMYCSYSASEFGYL